MSRTIVGILRGGASSEYDASLKSGAALLQVLPEDRYDARDIFIDRSGLWHSRGMPSDPARAFSQLDVVFSALHGGAGEDGTVQRILERAGMPYVGSRPLGASIAQNKILTRRVLQKAGYAVPRGVSFSVRDGTTGDMAMQTFAAFSPPYVVKPAMEGSSIGIVVAETLRDLPDAIGDVLDGYGTALIEEFVQGEEVKVGVIEEFRNEALYTLPAAHIVLPDEVRYLHHDVLRDDAHEVVVPSNFTYEQKQEIAQLAKNVHRALGLSHYSSIDMRLSNRGPIVLEADALPHMHDKSVFRSMLESVGSSLRDFAEHIIARAQH
jgi:D-alanine-D-alanine ligase